MATKAVLTRGLGQHISSLNGYLTYTERRIEPERDNQKGIVQKRDNQDTILCKPSDKWRSSLWGCATLLKIHQRELCEVCGCWETQNIEEGDHKVGAIQPNKALISSIELER